jgi:hypothetical protein
MELCVDLIVLLELMGTFKKDSACHANLHAKVVEVKLTIAILVISRVYFLSI